MQIIVAHPPNWDEIVAAFPQAPTPGVIFAYGSCIYNPSNVVIPEQLIAHENVHGTQQRGMGPRAWWRSYIEDVGFRAQQELAAHCEEYRVYCGLVKDRNTKARALHMIAQRLSGPLYCHAMSFADAKRQIMAAA